jgi:tetratricopeptide (TPR) repeat protein
MRKVIVAVIAMSLFLGCQPRTTEKKYEGAQEKKNYMALGMKYLSEKDIVKAIASFDQAIRQDPRNIENYLTLGRVYLHLKIYDRAIDTFAAATRVDPVNGMAYYFLSLSQGERNKPEDRTAAIEAVKKSIIIFKQKKDEENFRKAMTLFQVLMGKQPETQKPS